MCLPTLEPSVNSAEVLPAGSTPRLLSPAQVSTGYIITGGQNQTEGHTASRLPTPEGGTHRMPNQKSRNILDISHFEEPIHLQILPVLFPEHGSSRVQWLMLGIPAVLRELRQGDRHKTGASLCYIVSSRPVLDTWWDSVSGIKRNQA